MEQLRALEIGLPSRLFKWITTASEDIPATFEKFRTNFKKQMKYVFVTGGVISSLGKGLTAAALGTLLENRGLKVTLQKFTLTSMSTQGHHEPVPAW